MSGMESTQSPIYSDPIHIDLHFPIAVKKGIRSCTQHPIANFISYHRLSPKHKSFLSSLDFMDVLKSVEEAVQNENWIHTMQEEMRALEKNQT